MITDSVSVVSW